MTSSKIILIITMTLTALMAGFFFSYSVSVSKGLGKLSDIDYIKAMQSINREVQNSLFFICFFGVVISLLLATVWHCNLNQTMFIYLSIASLVYLVGVFGVTVFGNVPLNNQLDKFDLFTSSKEAIYTQRHHFESRWNYWNNIRTVTSLTAFILVIFACVTSRAV